MDFYEIQINSPSFPKFLGAAWLWLTSRFKIEEILFVDTVPS